ncbi:MAG: trimethylamine methyltransferase family protein [Candidatus Brocadiae bacterium]|nr:trimethylamine methyltransferase family protein [Candidatus Brocadiia bacterium]
MAGGDGCEILRAGRPVVLSDEQMRRIHVAILELLERTGVRIGDPQARDVLVGAGAEVTGEDLVRIPPEAVEKAIDRAPDRVRLFTRTGNHAMDLGGHRSYFGSHADCPKFLNPATRTQQAGTSKHAGINARVTDYLPNIAFIILGGSAGDCREPQDRPALVFTELVSNTAKPIGVCHSAEAPYNVIMELARMVAGGDEQLRARPFIFHYWEPTTPLVHTGEALRKLMWSVRDGIPVVYTPMLMTGATCPCSLASEVMLCSAESLVGLVIAQEMQPGAPFIFGGIPTIMDMRSTICSYGAPEMWLMVMAVTDMAHYYKLPMFGTAGCTDAKEVDQQAAVEAALSCATSIMSGANLIHDIGLLDHAEIASPEMMVLCDEIIAMLRAASQEIEVNDETLGLDLIHKVGPGGHFLAEEHTLENFRKVWYPTMMDRSRLGTHAAKELVSFTERLNRKTRNIIETHQPEPLPREVQDEFRRRQKAWTG